MIDKTIIQWTDDDGNIVVTSEQIDKALEEYLHRPRVSLLIMLPRTPSIIK